jgi:hypothetical protein
MSSASTTTLAARRAGERWDAEERKKNRHNAGNENAPHLKPSAELRADRDALNMKAQ